MSSGGRKPHYRLKGWHKGTGRTSELGVAWKNDNGSISISVNSGCVLGLIPELVYNLWPIDSQSKEQEGGSDPSGPNEPF